MNNLITKALKLFCACSKKKLCILFYPIEMERNRYEGQGKDI